MGSRLYLKELTNRALIERDGISGSSVFQEGDIVLKINSTPTEGLSLKDAKKLMENCKDKLQLTVRRATDIVTSTGNSSTTQAAGSHHHQQQSSLIGAVGGPPPPPLPAAYDPTYAGKDPSSSGAHFNGNGNYSDNSRTNYCNQNLYVQPPTRGGSVDYRNPLTPQQALPNGGQAYGEQDNKPGGGNLSRLGGRSRGPLMDVSLSQLDHQQQQQHHHHMNGHGEGEDIPPRPPPPRTEDFYGTRTAPEPQKPPPTYDLRLFYKNKKQLNANENLLLHVEKT